MALQFWLHVLEAAMRARGIRRRRLSIPSGYDLSYHERGARKPGVPVVLVHGLAASSVSWVRIIPHLARLRRVLALDLPGFGFSQLPPGQDHATIPDHVRALVEFLDSGTVQGPVILVGNSLGGWVAAKAARLRPDRVEQLVLVNAAGVLYPNIGDLRERLHVETRDQVREFWNRMWYRVPFYYLYFWRDYIGHMRDPRVRKFLESVQESHFLNADLAHLRMPVTIVWGRSDRFLSEETVDVLLDQLPDGRVYWMPRTGHIPQLENPSLFVEILRGLLGRSALPPGEQTGFKPSPG